MKAQSAKAKGRRLQQLVRDKIIERFPKLTKRDVRSTGMGQGGADVQLSEAAHKLFPYQIECKSRKSMALYQDYEQACSHGDGIPLLVVKADRKKPLVVLDLDTFMEMEHASKPKRR